MASPQDGPTRKHQKIRARRKLAAWREKQAALKAAEGGAPAGEKPAAAQR